MYRLFLYVVIGMIAISACNVQRHLPVGETLYGGAEIRLQKQPGVKASAHSLKKQLRLAVKPSGNKTIFGQPYKVWWWYTIGEPKHKNGIAAFFRNKLGEPPILSSKVNPTVTARNMQSFLNNLGYFHSSVAADTVNKRYITTAFYTAKVFPQYRIRTISWVNDSSDLVQLLEEKQRDGILQPGKGYRLSDIQAERERLDLYLKTKGYYYFSPSYIMAYADSSMGNQQVDLIFTIKRPIPEIARHPYRINQVAVFPNYTLLLPPPDTSRTGMIEEDGLLIRDTVHKFNPSLFKEVITYRSGGLYSSRDQNTTLNRLMNLGTFKFAKNRFERVGDSLDPYRLNVYYYLTPAKNRSIQTSVNGFSKENKYIGTQLSVNWRSRNTLKGAELLLFRLYGGFELSFADTLRNSNNYRGGVEAAISLPRFFVPFIRVHEKNLYPPHTRLLVGYEVFRKQFFYSKNIFRLEYVFNWKQTSNKEHILAPFAFTYINSRSISDTFQKQIASVPGLKANLFDEIILGSFYAYTFNTANPFAKKQWFFNASMDWAGNIVGLVKGAKEPRTKTLFNTPFAQYVKADVDARYHRKLRNNKDWVSRLQIGIGLPYNNSAMLPFSKQYMIGGSASMRGFRMRQMGPGSYSPTREDQAYFMVIGGDYKLQLNTEMRIPIFAKFSGAVFTDIGNIWTKDTLLFGKAGQLKKDFYKELAVASGIGIRFDAGLVLLRLDLGLPLRKPSYPDGQRWVIDEIDLGNKIWRQQNIIWNFALGFPF